MAACGHNKDSPLRTHWFFLTAQDWLYEALKHAGLASASGGIIQDSSLHSETNLRPSRDQAAACSGWLLIQRLNKVKICVATIRCNRGNSSIAKKQQQQKTSSFTMRLSSLHTEREGSSGVTVPCPVVGACFYRDAWHPVISMQCS